MADWGPVVIALVLFVLLTPGLLVQIPGRNKVVEFGNMQTSAISIVVHAVIYFGLITIFLVAIGVHIYTDSLMEEDTVSMISYARVREDLDSNSTNSVLHQPSKLRRVQHHYTTTTTNASHSSSRFKGVVSLQNGHWGAQIYTNHQRIWLGTFKSDKEAAMAYDSAAIKLRSDDLHRNFPWNSYISQEPIFQSHLSKEVVLSMIKDGTYQSRFEDYLRNEQHSNGENRVELSLGASPRVVVSGDKKGGSTCQLLFQKELTLSDVGNLNRLVIPKKYAVRHFPRLSEAAESTQLVLFDKEIKAWTFRYCYWRSSQSFVFTKGWNRFVKEKQLKEKDVISFYKCECRRGTREGRTFLMIDNGVENSRCPVKGLGELEVEEAPPVDNVGVRLFGVQIG